jgi:hypothetical protein
MQFGNFNDFHSDVRREVEGVPMDLGEGRTLIVRRSGTRNREFLAAVAGIDPQERAAQIEVMARTIVCGWHGVKDRNGQEIPYSFDACKALFEFAPDLLDSVAVFAVERGNFASDEIKQEKDALKKT